MIFSQLVLKSKVQHCLVRQHVQFSVGSRFYNKKSNEVPQEYSRINGFRARTSPTEHNYMKLKNTYHKLFFGPVRNHRSKDCSKWNCRRYNEFAEVHGKTMIPEGGYQVYENEYPEETVKGRGCPKKVSKSNAIEKEGQDARLKENTNKRGRPRKIPANSGEFNSEGLVKISSDDSGNDDSIKKVRRGRPRKNVSDSVTENDISIKKEKRGRPGKKVSDSFAEFSSQEENSSSPINYENTKSSSTEKNFSDQVIKSAETLKHRPTSAAEPSAPTEPAPAAATEPATEPATAPATEPAALSTAAHPLYNPAKAGAMFETGAEVLSLPYIYTVPRTPSVSAILSATQSEQSRATLARWKESMVESMGQEGFDRYQQELFSEGTLLHAAIERRLKGGAAPEGQQRAQLKGYWDSVGATVEELRDVAAVETAVVHPTLHYAGVVDCVATYRNTPVLVEWKTSTKPKPTLQSTFEHPLQVAAYLGALSHDQCYQAAVPYGLLVYGYASGRPADVHLLSPALLERYWSQWLQRVQLYRSAR